MVGAHGRTLYLFAADEPNRGTLSGAGLAAWAAFRATVEPQGVGGASATRIAMIGATSQVTYAGHPLYDFIGVQDAGQTNRRAWTGSASAGTSSGQAAARLPPPLPRPARPPELLMATEQLTPLAVGHRELAGHVALGLGALSVLGIGADHIEQYLVQNYSTVPTIGSLFLLNFISSVVVAVALVAPLGRVAGRVALPLRRVFAVGGIGLGAGSLAGLMISETSSLFGFAEHGYRTAIVLSIVAEVAAVVFLSLFLLLSTDARRSR